MIVSDERESVRASWKPKCSYLFHNHMTHLVGSYSSQTLSSQIIHEKSRDKMDDLCDRKAQSKIFESILLELIDELDLAVHAPREQVDFDTAVNRFRVN